MKIIYLFLATTILIGCSSPEDHIYASFKCSKVAIALGQEKDADISWLKAKPHIEKAGITQSNYGLELGEKFQKDLELYKYTTGSQVKIMNDVYESDECQELYQAE